MSSKYHSELSSAVELQLQANTQKSHTKQNAYPRTFGGMRLQQRQLPSEFLELALKNRISENGKVVAPSNLNEIRRSLKAKELKVG